MFKSERFFSIKYRIAKTNQEISNLTVEEKFDIGTQEGGQGFGFGKIDARSLDLLAVHGYGP